MSYNFKVNLGGMIDILASHLYSNSGVFVRELLQNGVDAISARKKHDPDYTGGKISIHVDSKREICFSDTGVGLTEDEIHQFLAVIGQSSKRDLTTGKIYDDYIGRFGIGLLSCFMVTDQIILRTRSAKFPDVALEWEGRPEGTYTIDRIPSDYMPVGTQVILKVKAGAEEYFNHDKITELVQYYGLPLPFPIVLARGETETRLNSFDVSRKLNYNEIIKLGEQLFSEKFIDFIPLESPTGKFTGVAYILPYEVAAHVNQEHRIYLKNMLLTEDGTMVLPKWAFFTKCFLNTTTLRPTASRENFYKDEDLDIAKKEITQCITQYFINLSKRNSDLLQSILRVHRLAIKSLCVTDNDVFKGFAPFIEFESTMGIINGAKIAKYNGTVYYTSDQSRYKQLAPFFTAQMRLLVNASYIYESDLIAKLPQVYHYADIQVIRDDGMKDFIDDAFVSEQHHAEFFIKSAGYVLARFEVEPVLKKFSPDSVPVLYYMDETTKQSREINDSMDKLKDSSGIFSSMLSGFAEEFEMDNVSLSPPQLYLNLNNPLVQSIIKLKDTRKIKAVTEILYVQALLSAHMPVSGEDFKMLNSGILTLLEGGVEMLYSTVVRPSEF